jgi:hypothetical protein
MTSKKSRGSTPSARASAIDCATPAVSMSTQALQASFSRLPAPASPSQSVLRPSASKTGASRSRALALPEARARAARGEEHQGTLLGRLPGAHDRAVHEDDAELVGQGDQALDAVDPDRRGLQPDRAGSGCGSPDPVGHRIRVVQHGEDDVGALGCLGGRVEGHRPDVGQRPGLRAVPVPHADGQPRAAQGADHARPHRPRAQHGHDGGGHRGVRRSDGGHSTRATARFGPPCAPMTFSGNPAKVNRVFTTLSRLARFS